MIDLLIFLGPFFAAGLLMLMAWWKVSHSIAAENAVVLEEEWDQMAQTQQNSRVTRGHLGVRA